MNRLAKHSTYFSWIQCPGLLNAGVALFPFPQAVKYTKEAFLGEEREEAVLWSPSNNKYLITHCLALGVDKKGWKQREIDFFH